MKNFIGTVLVVASACMLFGCSGTVGPDFGDTDLDTPKVKVTSISITSESNVTEIE